MFLIMFVCFFFNFVAFEYFDEALEFLDVPVCELVM